MFDVRMNCTKQKMSIVAVSGRSRGAPQGSSTVHLILPSEEEDHASTQHVQPVVSPASWRQLGLSRPDIGNYVGCSGTNSNNIRGSHLPRLLVRGGRSADI